MINSNRIYRAIKSSWIPCLLVLMLIASLWLFGFKKTHYFIKKLDNHIDTRIDPQVQPIKQHQRTQDLAIAELQLTSQQTRDQLQQLDAQCSQFSNQAIAMQSDQQAREAFYQALMHDRERLTLLEIQHVFVTLHDLLPLTGDVQLAVAALESADQRLATFHSARVKAVRHAISQDLATLKAVPAVDLVEFANALDQAYQQIDTLPFIGDTVATIATLPQATQNNEDEGSGWRAIGARVSLGLMRQLKSLVQIHPLDHADPLLISTDQRFFIRENLKLWLLSARLSLLSYRLKALIIDLNRIDTTLQRYFDLASPQVQTVRHFIQPIQQMIQATDLNLDLNLNTSLSALRQSEVQK